MATELKNIKIEARVHQQLADIGNKGLTYSQIIEKLVHHYLNTVGGGSNQKE